MKNTKTPTFYLDMDGVVADWATGAARITGHRMNSVFDYYSPDDWAKIVEHGRLFSALPLVPRARELADVARRFRDELGWHLFFLTAVPHNNDMPWAFHDKIAWAGRYFPDIPVHFGPFSDQKSQHCKAGDILVDDRPDNCAQWAGAGGRAFLVKEDLDSVIVELRDRVFAEYRGMVP